MTRLLCLWRHRPVKTAVINLGDDHTWHQETCGRCGAQRQYIVTPLGMMEPTSWG